MPKYNVTGWIPTALYATVVVEAPSAQEALKIGEPMLSEVGEYEYVDDNATCSPHDELRAESEEATDTANWSATDDLKVAARRMVAALKTANDMLSETMPFVDDDACKMIAAVQDANNDSIAAAEAAGIVAQ